MGSPIGSALVAALACMEPGQAVPAQAPLEHTTTTQTAWPRVRTNHPEIAALLGRAASQSPTVRNLIERIHRTDGMVYVLLDRCGRGVRACLPYAMTLAGDTRVLRVIVEQLSTDADAIGAIAHELQHAVEVLEEPSIKTSASMYLYYRSYGSKRGDVFETPGAIAAGHRARGEVSKRPTGVRAETRNAVRQAGTCTS